MKFKDAILKAIADALKIERAKTDAEIARLDARLDDMDGRKLFQSVSTALLDQRLSALKDVVTAQRYEKATSVAQVHHEVLRGVLK